MYNYSTIKDLAAQLRQRGLKYAVTDLIALAAQNDPFYVGTDTDIKNGRWFAALWQQFGYAGNIHLRRMHYQIISQAEPVLMPDGAPYENTLKCWNYLEMASKNARYLEYVDPQAFVDRRNPEPKLFAVSGQGAPQIYLTDDLSYWDFAFPAEPSLPRYGTDGFLPDQRYHLEIWVEKSTMNDVLLPLCERYGVNFVTGVGEQSITSTIQLVQRAIQSGKPVRVFYISDFDPAGRSMPVAVARKAEYYLQKFRADLDFRLFPIALTQEQCHFYSLPRTPIKETEKRKDHFEQQHGDGATELDALEALHPDALRGLVQEAILNYYDGALATNVRSQQEALEQDLKAVRRNVLAAHIDELEELAAEYETLRTEFEERMASYKEQYSNVWHAMHQELEAECLNIANYPLPEGEERAELGDGLLDSRRSYLAQLHVYKAFQGKSNGFDRATLDLLEG